MQVKKLYTVVQLLELILMGMAILRLIMIT